jgi:uncharacterized protein YoxC
MALLASLTLLQGGWEAPVAAIALVVIALSFLAIAATIVLLARGVGRKVDALSRQLGELRQEVDPALKSLREIGETGRGLSEQVAAEVREVIQTSHRLRHDVERGARRARHRLADLDALAEVVQGEVEETALDVAAALRSVRTGRGVIGRIRRLLRGRR